MTPKADVTLQFIDMNEEILPKSNLNNILQIDNMNKDSTQNIEFNLKNSYVNNVDIQQLSEYLKTHNDFDGTFWLNDNLLNSFFHILQHFYPKNVFLNSFTLSSNKVQQKQITNILRDDGNRDIFIPLNLSNIHWVLIHVNINSISIWDSQKQGHDNLHQILGFHLADINAEASYYATNLQKDLNSCGIFVCLFVLALMENIPITEVRFKKIITKGLKRLYQSFMIDIKNYVWRQIYSLDFKELFLNLVNKKGKKAIISPSYAIKLQQ